MNLDNVGEGIKTLVEIGKSWEVNEDWSINNINNDKVNIVIKDNAKELVVLHESMIAGDYTILNPFAEPATLGPELNWFYDSKNMLLGKAFQLLIEKILEGMTSGKLPKGVPASVKKLGKPSKALLSTIKDIESTELIELIYLPESRRNKTSNTKVQSRFMKHPSDYDLDKKSITIMEGIYDILLDGNSFEIFGAKCTEKDLPRYTSFFLCISNLYAVLNPKLEVLTKHEVVDVDQIRVLVSDCMIYHKLAKYFISTSPPREYTGTVTPTAPYKDNIQVNQPQNSTSTVQTVDDNKSSGFTVPPIGNVTAEDNNPLYNAMPMNNGVQPVQQFQQPYGIPNPTMMQPQVNQFGQPIPMQNSLSGIPLMSQSNGMVQNTFQPTTFQSSMVM